MTDRPTNQAGDPTTDEQEDQAGAETSALADDPIEVEVEGEGEGGDGEDEIPVEVEGSDDEAGELAETDGAFSHEDLLELVGQAESEKAELAKRLAELEERAEALEAEKKDTYERLLRSAADMENLRKRTRKEVDDARIDARSRVLKEMLPVIDNLERAVDHAEKSGEGDAGGVMEGVQLVLRQFGQALERCEASPIDAKGQPFDPNLHEAVSQVEAPGHAPGTIVEVLQRGYTIGSRLLRASLVVVASASSRPAAPPEAEAEAEAAAPVPSADDADEGAAEPATPDADAEAGEGAAADDADREPADGEESEQGS